MILVKITRETCLFAHTLGVQSLGLVAGIHLFWKSRISGNNYRIERQLTEAYFRNFARSEYQPKYTHHTPHSRQQKRIFIIQFQSKWLQPKFNQLSRPRTFSQMYFSTVFHLICVNVNRFSKFSTHTTSIDSVRCSLLICSTKAACRLPRGWRTSLT